VPFGEEKKGKNREGSGERKIMTDTEAVGKRMEV
jgi:hypothetical protein